MLGAEGARCVSSLPLVEDLPVVLLKRLSPHPSPNLSAFILMSAEASRHLRPSSLPDTSPTSLFSVLYVFKHPWCATLLGVSASGSLGLCAQSGSAGGQGGLCLNF